MSAGAGRAKRAGSTRRAGSAKPAETAGAGAPVPEAVHAALAAATADPHAAFVHVDAAHVAAQVDARAPGPLAGVPFAVKDNLADAGQPLEACSRVLAGHRAAYTATAIERLRAAGAVVVGRTNMDELAMGSSTERSFHGSTRNPRDPTRSPGGSSGGSAAAVAAGIVPFALGSDTGGSARQPAAFCGVVGVKPTWGRVSRRGLVAFAASLDTVGVLARDVRTAARVTATIAGPDPGDATTADLPVPDWTIACDHGVAGLRVGVLVDDNVDPDVAAGITAAVARLAAAGAVVTPLTLDLAYALPAYQVLAAAEASSNLARYDGVRYGPRAPATELSAMYAETRAAGFGPEVTRRVLLGTRVLSDGGALHARAEAARARVTATLHARLADLDLLVGPTAPTVAFPLGARAHDPLAMYAADRFTVPASLAGLPALSVPAPTTGLPVGVHLAARPFDEAALFAAAAVIERG